MLSLIVCVDSKGGFSKAGQIPWIVKQDSLMFMDTTKKGKKNAIIMGKNTWFSLPENCRGFKDRINIVVSNTLTDTTESNTTKAPTHIVKSLEDGINLSKSLDVEHTFIGGGLNIYKEALNKHHLDHIYLTEINKDYKCDLFLPEVPEKYKVIFNKIFSVDDHVVNFRRLSSDQINDNEGSERGYLDLMERVIRGGDFRQTRNASTWSLFGVNLEFDLTDGYPLLTTKRVSLYNVYQELIFFIRGQTNTNILSENGVNIWKSNTSREFLDSRKMFDCKEGDMGPMYGFQWRHFNYGYGGFDKDYTGCGVDQLQNCINSIKNDPYGRRHIMTSFNPVQVEEGCLYPCHGIAIQFYVTGTGLLSCLMMQRSADLFLGLPYNIASYSLLLHMICEVINNDDLYLGPQLRPGKLHISIGDAHLYENHYNQAIRQILREPRVYPRLSFKRQVKNMEDFEFEDIVLDDYDSYPNIIAQMIA